MKTIGWALSLALLGNGTCVAAPRLAPSDYVLVGVRDGRIALAQPLPAAIGQVASAEWSPNGQYVLSICRDLTLPDTLTLQQLEATAAGEYRVTVWHRDQNRSHTLGRWKGKLADAPQIYWLPGTSIAFFFLPEMSPQADGSVPVRWRLLRVDAARRSVLGIADTSNTVKLIPSPSRAYAMVVDADSHLLLSQNPRQPARSLDLPGLANLHDGYWTIDGSTFVATIVAPNEQRGQFVLIDAETARYRISREAPPRSEARPERSELRVEIRRVEIRNDVMALNPSGSGGSPGPRLQSLWLRSTTATDPKEALALVAPDVQSAVLAPAGDALLYVNREGAWVRPFQRIPKQVVDIAKTRAQTVTAVSNAR